MDEIVRAAGELPGADLSDPVDLGGSECGTALRCRTADGGSAIVEAFGSDPESRGFTAEVTGLSLGPDGLARAIAVWTVDLTVRLLPRAARDAPMRRSRRPVPTRRQGLRYRWEPAATLDGLPAVAETARLPLRRVAAGWAVAPPPGYRAFEA